MKTNNKTPVLYSFRRCPYAIRARLAIRYADISVELREVQLKNKPHEMLRISPKGTVPVLITADNQVLEESLDIIQWALSIHDPDNWMLTGQAHSRKLAQDLIQQNDTHFKQSLDRYKYSDRYPEFPLSHHRYQCEQFIGLVNQQLRHTSWLTGDSLSYADIAIMPFIRQFAIVDLDWFQQSPYEPLKSWLNSLLDSDMFTNVMQKYKPWIKEQKVYF